MTTRWQRVARATVGDDYAARYAARFRALAERGADTHGEAALVASLVAAPARVLDAGCGTGRTTVRLADLGYDVVGCDVDDAMLAVARDEAPGLDWRLADLATTDLGTRFDLVLLAGNVVPLVEPGTLPAVAERIAAHLAPDGRVVAGFGLDRAHLPAGCPVTPLHEYDAALAAAGLVPGERWSTWEQAAFDEGSGYVVTVGGPG